MTSDPEATARLEAQPRALAAAAQFAPGTMIAGRYRIASLLGSGGMGEVYRADDTRLDQPVALKFLPPRLARDAGLRARLHDEVRLGRQIAHPNVCRIYDIVDYEESHFVAMEYVDGEDLARLLKRIGRLAHDKAVDIARGVAAGLAAAHAKGILHRDLKPANVMIDSRGEARIMDFGLALAAGEDDGTISGTPAYMAPEQLAAQAATVQSDLYALGLVMYELFTGRRAHNARTLHDRLRDATSEITTPSSLVRDIDPAVERIILRCLAADPVQRPRSARAVIESLPGGDPLAAALAAGETPSPRIVAAAGAEGSLSPRAAWSMLAAVALLLAAFAGVRWKTAMSRYTSLERSPEVLRQGAHDILRTLGVPAEGTGVATMFRTPRLTGWLFERGGDDRWKPLANGPGALRYRLELGRPPRLARLAPPLAAAPGWTTIEVDQRGRLALLLAIPENGRPARALDWGPLLAAAGLDSRTLREITPTHAPPAPFDARAAWSGTYPRDATPIRAEAAAWRGTPVFFRITGDWDATPPRSEIFGPQTQRFGFVLVCAVLVIALFLAWRNLRLRRGDRQAAFRVAAAFFALAGATAIISGAYGSGLHAAMEDVMERLGAAAIDAIALFLMYIALEPYARRHWPEQLIAWVRLVGGRPGDPLVGRHVLIGILAGLAHVAISSSSRVFTLWSGGMHGPRQPTAFGSVRETIGAVLDGIAQGTSSGFTFTILLVVLTIVLRKRALAAGAVFLFYFAYFVIAVDRSTELLPFYAFVAALLALVSVRYGLLAMVAMWATFEVLLFTPVDAADWVLPLTIVRLGAIAAVAVWAFRVSLGGQSAFGESP